MTSQGRVSYKDVKATILERLRDKTWPAGEILPGEVELAAEFNCARTTINRAMRELADEGFLDRRRKAGTRVNPRPIRQARFAIPVIRAEIESKGFTYRYALVKRTITASPDWLRSRLSQRSA